VDAADKWTDKVNIDCRPAPMMSAGGLLSQWRRRGRQKIGDQRRFVNRETPAFTLAFVDKTATLRPLGARALPSHHSPPASPPSSRKSLAGAPDIEAWNLLVLS
jgi:hypothetical protein